MATQRKVEIFSAGCPVCQNAIDLVKKLACPSCDVAVLDMADTAVAKRAAGLGIHRVPAIVVDGKLADCCAGPVITEESLRATGIGQPIS